MFSHFNFLLIDLAPNVWLHSSVSRASHWVRIPMKPWYFQASSFQLLKLETYCDNHSSQVCIKARLPAASLPFKGQVTEHTTVQRSPLLSMLLRNPLAIRITEEKQLSILPTWQWLKISFHTAGWDFVPHGCSSSTLQNGSCSSWVSISSLRVSLLMGSIQVPSAL